MKEITLSGLLQNRNHHGTEQFCFSADRSLLHQEIIELARPSLNIKTHTHTEKRKENSAHLNVQNGGKQRVFEVPSHVAPLPLLGQQASGNGHDPANPDQGNGPSGGLANPPATALPALHTLRQLCPCVVPSHEELKVTLPINVAGTSHPQFSPIRSAPHREKPRENPRTHRRW